MAIFEIDWKISDIKELRAVDKKYILQILQTIESLKTNPYPKGSRKLKGSKNLYRIKIGEYRAIYQVDSSR